MSADRIRERAIRTAPGVIPTRSLISCGPMSSKYRSWSSSRDRPVTAFRHFSRAHFSSERVNWTRSQASARASIESPMNLTGLRSRSAVEVGDLDLGDPQGPRQERPRGIVIVEPPRHFGRHFLEQVLGVGELRRRGDQERGQRRRCALAQFTASSSRGSSRDRSRTSRGFASGAELGAGVVERNVRASRGHGFGADKRVIRPLGRTAILEISVHSGLRRAASTTTAVRITLPSADRPRPTVPGNGLKALPTVSVGDEVSVNGRFSM